MSVLISDTIPDIQLETQTVGVRINTNDIILAYKRANSYYNSTYKMPTTERETNLLVYPGVFEYGAPSDFLGWFQPMRPYGNISPWFLNTTENELVHGQYTENETAFKFDRENLFFIVSLGNNGSPFGSSGGNQNAAQIIVNSCDTITDNGTVSISGDGSNLIEDTQIFVEGSGSFRFLITDSAGTTTIVNSSMSPVAIAQNISLGWFFLSLYCPTTNTSAISNVRLRIGSDNTGVTNYYEMNATQAFRGDSIKNFWVQVGFDGLLATTVGSPNTNNLTYMQVVITNGVTGTSGIYRLDNVFFAQPSYFELPYYSKNNIKANDGTYKQNPTASDDTILCPEDTNDAFIYKSLEYLAIYNLKDQGLAMLFSARLAPFENTLKIKYPSQERKVKTQYYRSPRAF